MFATEAAKAALGRNVPAPSFDRPMPAPEPAITAEIQRLQADCADLATSAINRVAELHQRLVGTVVSPDGAQIQEGLRWPPEGDLGRSYHQAYQLREALNRLNFELAQLETI
jgi:hypothetical protein